MDKTIMLWDVSSGNWTRKWRGHQVIMILTMIMIGIMIMTAIMIMIGIMIMIMTLIMIMISSGGCELRLIQRGQQPSD